MEKTYTQSIQKALEGLGVSEQGLSSVQAKERLEKYGPNKLKDAEKPTLLQRFLAQLKDPMLIILMIAAAVSAITNVIAGESLAEVFIILIVVLLNAVLGVFQESKAEAAIEDILIDNKFGDAGCRVVVEEFLTGQEVSILAFADGKTVVPMVSAQDHKRIFDGDQGLNTGGMGAYSPAPIYTEEVNAIVVPQVLEATIAAMNEENRSFSGILYAGLMLTPTGPKVLEFNARFGDPETQAVLPRLETDLVDIMLAVVEGRLAEMDIVWKEEAAVTVVMASGGYPETSEKGQVITGLEEAAAKGTIVFHAGTKESDGKIVTNGGRVLAVSALGENIAAAIEKAYEGVKEISFANMQYRTDIGKKALM